jgi:dolichol-phosphate mannosyltransferase
MQVPAPRATPGALLGIAEPGWDAVFGSRLVKGGGVIDYAWSKLRQNRLAKVFILLQFASKLKDTRNAFKARRISI